MNDTYVIFLPLIQLISLDSLSEIGFLLRTNISQFWSRNWLSSAYKYPTILKQKLAFFAWLFWRSWIFSDQNCVSYLHYRRLQTRGTMIQANWILSTNNKKIDFQTAVHPCSSAHLTSSLFPTVQSLCGTNSRERHMIFILYIDARHYQLITTMYPRVHKPSKS